jgi:hypothetical protein
VGPNSGWVTYRIRSNKGLQHAVWLKRLSYFRYAMKTADDPRELFAEASRELQLTAQFKPLLEQFVPLTKNQNLAFQFGFGSYCVEGILPGLI